jgi:hypothetical protein
MDWSATLIGLAVMVGLGLLCGWLGARPPNLSKGPRLIPYRFLMLLAGAGVMVLLAHLGTLSGLNANRN